MPSPDPVQKYLETYAEPEIQLVSKIPDRIWTDTLVIPARTENEHLFRTLQSVEKASQFSDKRVLVILVVNGQANEIEENQKVLHALGAVSLSDGFHFIEKSFYDIVVIDRASASRCFQEKEGVGLARKIGCDFALSLIQRKRILSPWIRNTDADVILPEDYFLALESHGDYRPAGFVYDFIHDSSPLGELAPALDLYDLSLRYYVAGISWAKSPYAFHTIGSALVIHAEAYAEVRGFPKREAGEDFYLLNKLAKIGQIEDSLGSPIQIAGRVSTRTPFGTGVKTQEIASKLLDGEDVLFYHPEIFLHLKEWVEVLAQFSHSTHSLQDEILLRSTGPFLLENLRGLDAIDAISKLKEKSKTPEIRLRQFHTWFDAFKTLKFVHLMRDTTHPSLPWKKALKGLSALTADNSLRYKSSKRRAPKIVLN
ncbi:MAG: hypothetical protein JWQ35_447 [Bacteriovoracaceae bacterium]|nr:hypothetical protein [Bacteriovoracaceae bacterium]